MVMVIPTKMIKVQSKTDYEYYRGMGFIPLASLIFDIDFKLRIDLQYELFGETRPENDIKFYKYAFHVKPQICEETDQPLYYYNAKYVSHILTRGAHPTIRHDLRNVNLVIPQIHTIWENEIESQIKDLKIYYRNEQIINILKNEYYG